MSGTGWKKEGMKYHEINGILNSRGSKTTNPLIPHHKVHSVKIGLLPDVWTVSSFQSTYTQTHLYCKTYSGFLSRIKHPRNNIGYWKILKATIHHLNMSISIVL
jgi:hypothetical protein